nr:hypothetical protein BRADI_4g17426v3 [Ipomoea trifida]
MVTVGDGETASGGIIWKDCINSESLIDLMAGCILWFTHLAMKIIINIYKYPIGKLRVQPVGITIFAATKATLGFQVLVQASCGTTDCSGFIAEAVRRRYGASPKNLCLLLWILKES